MKQKQKTLVLLSGGQDSTTALYWALERFETTALSVNYEQRHAAELRAAKQIAKAAGVDLRSVSIKGFTSGPLLEPSADVRVHAFTRGRNLLLLSAASMFAHSIGVTSLVVGFCADDYEHYPDCRAAFLGTAKHAMAAGGAMTEIHAPLLRLTKAEIVKLSHGIPGCWEAIAKTVTCYEGASPGCGKCASCVTRAKGFRESGHTDPAIAYTPSNTKKLTGEGLLQIRSHKGSIRALARDMGVNESTVRSAKKGFTWKQ